MSSLLKTLLDRWYPTKGLTVAIFGESWSGKSSVVAIATGTGTVPYGNMGFIYSAVEAPTSTGKPLKFEACDIGLGCGSVSRMGVLYAGLVSWTDAMIWVVDSSRREDLNTSVSALMMIMGAVEEKRRETKKLKTKLPVLILANKQDVPEAMSVDEIRQAFKYFTKHYTSIILPTSLVGPYGSSGLQHGMDWLQVMLDNPSLLSKIGSLPKPQGEEKVTPKYPKDFINKIESWVVRLDKDVSDGEFIRLFETFELPSWDHYTHIRVAYLLITIHGRQKGKDMIFDGLKAYIEQNETLAAPSTSL